VLGLGACLPPGFFDFVWGEVRVRARARARARVRVRVRVRARARAMGPLTVRRL